MILLLTGCINPQGMTMTALSDKEERKEQYVKAINYYLENTKFPIVFAENSGTDISILFKNAIKSGRLEYLSFDGNHAKERGKGYGECEIIQYALRNSLTIRSAKDKRVAKITGRLIIKNINNIINIHNFFFSKQTVFCAINSNLSFPDSRFIIAPESFYYTFLKHKEGINDSLGQYFEHILCQTIKEEKQIQYSPFYIQPQIIGISGSDKRIYEEGNKSIIFIYKYARFATSQLFRFNKLYR